MFSRLAVIFWKESLPQESPTRFQLCFQTMEVNGLTLTVAELSSRGTISLITANIDGEKKCTQCTDYVTKIM